jgi:hypothetical protein
MKYDPSLVKPGSKAPGEIANLIQRIGRSRKINKPTNNIMDEDGIFKIKNGGFINYFAGGGYAKGMDKIPAMLSAGEYVVKKKAVDTIGIDNMDRINKGQLPNSSNSLYNYNLSVNVSNSNANPNDIARTVINQIRQVDAQRIRGNR